MRRMRARHVALLAAATSVAAFVACTLNPQPLPPRDDFGGESSFADAGGRSDSGTFNTGPQAPSADAAAIDMPSPDSEGGAGGDGGSDGGDGGDGGDGASDASDDGG